MFRNLCRTAAALLALLPAAAPAQSTVQLLDAGASAREPLRYSFKSGSTERAGLDMTMQMNLLLAGQQVPMAALPPIAMELELRVTEVAADGTARLQFELISATAAGDPAQAAQINQQLATLKGLSGGYRMSPQGLISDADARLPQGVAAGEIGQMLSELQQTLQQLAVPLPGEAVGTGARWQVTQNSRTAEMSISQTVEYTLRARTGSSLSLDVKMVDSRVDASAGLPPGTRLDSVRVTGGGSSTVRLDRLVPTASIDSDTEVVVSATEQGEDQSMRLNLKMKQSIAPAAR